MPCLALVAGLAFFTHHSAMAEEPFEIDIGQWRSTEGYDDNEARRPKPQTEEKIPKAPVISDHKPTTPEEYPNAAFRTPLLPGVNKGFNLDVKSTEDEKQDMSQFSVRDDVALPEDNWKPLTAKTSVDAKKGIEEENPPLNVRMTFLPSKGMTQASKAERDSAPRKGHDLMRLLTEQKRQVTPKTPEEAAACRALDAYKKQQLDAIQSDRETLKALQDAIKSLGLAKQLQFMTEQNSALSSPVVSTVTPDTTENALETSTR